MQDVKTYLYIAPILGTLWFEFLAQLLIEINFFFQMLQFFHFLNNNFFWFIFI